MLAGTFVRDRALNPLANPSRLQRLWLCEAVRLREEQAGLLDDSAIVRQLRHEALDLPQRIEQRALRLAARDGQASALQHAVQGARLALLLLAVLAVAGGFSMALAALGDGLRPVNLLWALGSRSACICSACCSGCWSLPVWRKARRPVASCGSG